MKKNLIGLTCGVLAVLGTGCASNPQSVRTKMISYSERGLYTQARLIPVKHNPGGITRTDEEVIKAQLIHDVVNPAEIASRVKVLKKRVFAHVKANDYEGARKVIYSFGVTGNSDVDSAVFAVKMALLNSRVNPVEWEKISNETIKAVDAALAKNDFKAAGAAIDKLVPVSAYSVSVDEALKAASQASLEQSISKMAADEVIAAAQGDLYDVLSHRPDNIQDKELLKEYFRAVASLTDYIYEPDWGRVKKSLADASDCLVDDDMSRDKADQFADDVLNDFIKIFNETAEDRLPTLTTYAMNSKIFHLKNDLESRVSKALDEALKAAAARKAAAEAARIAAEAEKAANAAKTEAEKAAAIARANAAKAAAEAARLHKEALELAARAARNVDSKTRINSFVDAVSDRVEPDINRVLGDGARVLRLLHTNPIIEKDDATSLLVAATYMGFDDVMNYALALGADVNGYSPKDTLKRAPILIAFQYGYKSHSAKILANAKASTTVRDARGRGVAHYAVLGANNSFVLDLLRISSDVKTPDQDGVTPFILAADHGFSSIVRMLIPFSDMEAKDNEGFTALLRAAEDGRVDIVRMLISSGAKVDCHANNGDGLIELAAAANAPELLIYLLDEKKFPPTERCTAQLVIAGNVPTLQQMVAHGAKLEDKHLAVAVKLGDFPMVKYLVSQGMDVNADCVKEVGAVGEISDFLYAQGQRR